MKEKIAVLSDKFIFSCLCIVIFCVTFTNAGVEIFVCFAFLGFIIKKIFITKSWKDYVPRQKTNLAVIIFFIANALSLINSGKFFKVSLEALILKWLEYIALYFVAMDTINTKKRINIVAIIFLASAGLIGIDGLYQRITGFDFFRHRPMGLVVQNNTPAIICCFNHYNDLATYLVTLIPLVFCAFFLLKNKNKLLSDILAIEMILLLSCLILTFSRGGWISIAVAFIFMVILAPKTRYYIYFSVLLLSIILLLYIAPRQRMLATFGEGGDATRFVYWEETFKMIKANPLLGRGVGDFMAKATDFGLNRIVGQYPHNCFLQIWAEAGIFTLLSFLWFIISLFISAIKTFKKCDNYLLLGALSGIFAFLAHSFLDTGLYSLRLAVLFWFMAGYVGAIIRLERDASRIA